MIPDYKTRSRQKTNRRELTSPKIAGQRAYFPRGVKAGELGMHINRLHRLNMKKYKHRITHCWWGYSYIPIF